MIMMIHLLIHLNLLGYAYIPANALTRALPYLLLGRQAAAVSATAGFFSHLSGSLTMLDKRAGSTVVKNTLKVRADGKRKAVRPRRR